jgi:hypothetical protein
MVLPVWEFSWCEVDCDRKRSVLWVDDEEEDISYETEMSQLWCEVVYEIMSLSFKYDRFS